MSFQFDETLAYHIRVLRSYYRRNFTVVLTNLIESEYERLQKSDLAELKKSEKFEPIQKII